MKTAKQKLIKKFKLLSEKYHNMSLLFYELSQSLNIELKKIENSPEQIKQYLKGTLNLDYNKIMKITKADLTIKELKGGINKNENKRN